MKPKCKYCGELAIRKTAFFSIDCSHLPFWTRMKRKYKLGKYHAEGVCEKHYLEFSQGIETVVCKCGMRVLFHSDDFYGDKELYCSFCRTKLEETEE